MSNVPTASAGAGGPTIMIRSSRVWALIHFRFTKLLFPSHLSADRLGITLVKVESWLTPWMRQDEHLPMSHLAEVTHQARPDLGFDFDREQWRPQSAHRRGSTQRGGKPLRHPSARLDECLN